MAALMNAELFCGHFRSRDAVGYLLEGDVTRIVGTAIIGLFVNAEGRETTIVRRAEALFVDIFRRGDQLIAHFLRRFGSRALRDDAANIGDLRNPFGVIAQVFADQLIGGFSVALAGHLHLEITGIELEQMLQQFLVRHVGAMDRIDIAARANVNAELLALLCRKAIEDPVIQLDEVRQKVAGSPRIARVVARRQTPFREVHDDVCGPSVEAGADVFLTFIDDVILKLLP